tara:strand:- start:3730 stop:3876 length:147 start_codon:yes stop_codon:yes gene_type:complete
MILAGYWKYACRKENKPIIETAKKSVGFSIQSTFVVAIPSKGAGLNSI